MTTNYVSPSMLPNLSKQKWDAIVLAASKLHVPAHHLAAVIAFETGESFSPLAQNPLSGAFGLIQFTWIGLQSIPDWTLGRDFPECKKRLSKLDFHDQLMGPVCDYLTANKGYGRTLLSDLYMSVLAPVAVGKPMDFKLYESPNKNYTQNKGLDAGRKGYITKEDAARQVYLKLDKVVNRLKVMEKERDIL